MILILLLLCLVGLIRIYLDTDRQGLDNRAYLSSHRLGHKLYQVPSSLKIFPTMISTLPKNNPNKLPYHSKI